MLDTREVLCFKIPLVVVYLTDLVWLIPTKYKYMQYITEEVIENL